MTEMSSIREYYRERYAERGGGDPGLESEPTFRRRVATALEAIGAAPRRVLDFGCNTGAASALLAAAGHRVVGVDISESAVALARQRVPSATFEQIDSESRLPFGDESFDVCFCSEVIEHLFDVTGFLREMNRVLRPEGCLLLTTPYHGWLKNLLLITFNFERHFHPTSGHIRFFTVRSLSECLEAAGFRVERVAGIGRRWPVWKSMFVVARKVSDD